MCIDLFQEEASCRWFRISFHQLAFWSLRLPVIGSNIPSNFLLMTVTPDTSRSQQRTITKTVTCSLMTRLFWTANRRIESVCSLQQFDPIVPSSLDNDEHERRLSYLIFVIFICVIYFLWCADIRLSFDLTVVSVKVVPRIQTHPLQEYKIEITRGALSWFLENSFFFSLLCCQSFHLWFLPPLLDCFDCVDWLIDVDVCHFLLQIRWLAIQLVQTHSHPLLFFSLRLFKQNIIEFHWTIICIYYD
jgi:hypothetical protein